MNEWELTTTGRTPARSPDDINLAQLWTISQLRKSLGLDDRQWNNLLKPYRIRSVHDLRQQQAMEVIHLLSTATHLREASSTSRDANRLLNCVNESRLVTSFPIDRESSTASTIHE